MHCALLRCRPVRLGDEKFMKLKLQSLTIDRQKPERKFGSNFIFQMLSGVEYVLSVRGENSFGVVGDERNISLKLVETPKGDPRSPAVSSLASAPAENLSGDAATEHKDSDVEVLEPRAVASQERALCASGIPPDVVLLGPVAVFVDTESWVEVTVSCCDGQVIADVLNQIQVRSPELLLTVG